MDVFAVYVEPSGAPSHENNTVAWLLVWLYILEANTKQAGRLWFG